MFDSDIELYGFHLDLHLFPCQDLYVRRLKFLFLLAPRIFQKQENMLRTVDLCLRLDAPAISVPLILTSFLLGETTPRSEPSVKPWLSHSLKSLLEEQENAILQEMLLVENFYLIGKVRFSTVCMN